MPDDERFEDAQRQFQCEHCPPEEEIEKARLIREAKRTPHVASSDANDALCRCGAYRNVVSAVRRVVEHTAAPGS